MSDIEPGGKLPPPAFCPSHANVSDGEEKEERELFAE